MNLHQFVPVIVLGVVLTVGAEAQSTLPEDRPGKDVMFLIDLSASMNRNNLFAEVKKSISETVAQALEDGDRVLVLGFDSDVRIIADQRIERGIQDVFEIQTKLAALKANGKWTYITKALDVAANQLARANQANPVGLKLIYLFTDGRNEPPPSEPHPITYADLSSKYLSSFKARNAHLYVLSFGATADSAQDDFIRMTGGEEIVGGGTPIPLPQATLHAVRALFKYHESVEGTISDSLLLQVGWARVKSPFELSIVSLTPQFSLRGPQSVLVERAGQKITIPFQFKYAGLPDEADVVLGTRFDKTKAHVWPDSIRIVLVRTPLPAVHTPAPAVSTPAVATGDTAEALPLPPSDLRWIPWLAGIVVIGAGAFAWLKWGREKFATTATLKYSDTVSESTYDLSTHTSLLRNSVSVGAGKDVDLDLGDAAFSVSPASGAVLVRVLKGIVRVEDSSGAKELLPGMKTRLEFGKIVIDDKTIEFANII